MMKRVFLILILIFSSKLLFSQEYLNYYEEALEMYEEHYYAKAIELLMEYIRYFPYDNDANELFEVIYEKYTVYQMEYLEAKEIFNQGLYSDAIEAFEVANTYGNSVKLQYYKDEASDQIFKIENLFLNSKISTSNDILFVEWWTDYTNTVITNASVFFVQGNNIPLIHTIYYFNKNEILLPNLSSFLGYANIFDSQKVYGTSAVFEMSPEQVSFIMIIYPETPDGVMTQPIIELYLEEPEIQDSIGMIENIEQVSYLPIFTNKTYYQPEQPPVLIAKNEPDDEDEIEKIATTIKNSDDEEDDNEEEEDRPDEDLTNILDLPKLTPENELLITKMIERIYILTNTKIPDIEELLTDMSITQLNFVTNELERTNIIIAWLENRTNEIEPPIETTQPEKRRSLWWLWLLLFIFAYLGWRWYVYRKEKLGGLVKQRMSLKDFLRNYLIPKKEEFKFGKNIQMWLFMGFIFSGFILVSFSGAIMDNPENSDIDPEVWEYCLDKYDLEDYEPYDYSDIVNFMAFEAGIEEPDYLRAIQLISNVAEHLREVATTYLDMYDYKNYALYSFMVYYLDKDYSYYTKAISELKDTTKKKVGYQLLTNSQTHNEEGKYLKALIEYTGFMALVPTAIKGDSFTILNDLFEEHKSEFSKYEYFRVVESLNELPRKVLYSGMEKAIYGYLEILSFEEDFVISDELSDYKEKLEDYIELNYYINLYNELISYGIKLYDKKYFEQSLQSFSMADRILLIDSDDSLLNSNINMLSNIIETEIYPVYILYTNSNGVTIQSELTNYSILEIEIDST